MIGLTAMVGVVVALVLGTAGAAPPAQTGVRGLVLYGPTCPVQRVGMTCERPYRAWITVRRFPSETLVARVHSAANGHFTVLVPAGRYRLAPRDGSPYPRAVPQIVTVRRGRLSTVTIRFDSGIR
ncbi:MAG: hypothetical protein ACRDNK_05155 [Solirubrobacteraceae bacterium]